MLSLDQLVAFTVAAIVLIGIPGPSVVFVIGRSLSYGRRGGLLSVAGNALGVVPLVAAVAFGLGEVIVRSATVFAILKLAGAAYLVYLGVHAITQRNAVTAAAPGGVDRVLSDHAALAQGFVVGISNPKTIVFLVAVLPQFVSASAADPRGQLAALGLVLVLVGLIGDALWALAAGSAQQWFARSPRRLAGVRATGGAMMVGLGGALALTGNRA